MLSALYDEKTNHRLSCLPPDERASIDHLCKEIALKTDSEQSRALISEVSAVVQAVSRRHMKAMNTRRSDLNARLTVSARLPVSDAIRHKKAAVTSGRSLYRYVADALEREYNATMGIDNPTPGC